MLTRLLIGITVAIAPCTVQTARAAVQCGGAPWLSHASLENQEAKAGEDYLKALSADFFLRLSPIKHGFQLKIADGIDQDLSILTPPIDAPVGPRFIEGWHFRNAANTGQNTGDINAPQLVRQYIFSPSAPGIYRQYGRNVPPDVINKVMRFGRGTLTINSYALTDTEPGKRAKMTKMNFDFCLEWASAAPVPTAPLGEMEPPAVPPHIVEAIKACNLADELSITPYIAPASYEPDFDGDARPELAVLISRVADSKRGIAVCWPQASPKRLDILGLEGEMDQLVPAYFDRMTDWLLQTERSPGHGMEQGAPPVLAGDSILLAKEESSSVLLYWDAEKQRFWSYWQGD